MESCGVALLGPVPLLSLLMALSSPSDYLKGKDDSMSCPVRKAA